MGKLFSQDKPTTIDSVPTLVEKALELGGGVYFRGHENLGWKLCPKIARFDTIYHAGGAIPQYNLPEQERLLLHRFRRHTYEQRGRVLNEWEVLFLARHHDLPVRLLDWTSNPLVALYFASVHEKGTEVNGAIWWFKRPHRRMHVDVFDPKPPFSYQGIQMVFPFYPTMRMNAQSGVFTIHSPQYWFDLKEMDKDDAKDGKRVRVDIREGGLWVVPAGAKATILKQLERFGINARTMFPELDGLAKGLMQTERFRVEEEYPKK